MNKEKNNRKANLVLLLCLVLSLLGLFLPRHGKDQSSLYEDLNKQVQSKLSSLQKTEGEAAESTKSTAPEKQNAIYIDGTKIVQASETNVTNITNTTINSEPETSPSLICTDGQTSEWASLSWICAADDDTDAQTLSLTASSLAIQNGNSVDLSLFLDNTDQQALSIIGNQLSISGANNVDLSSYLDNTDSQSLTWNSGSRTLSLTDGGSVIIADTDTTYSAGLGLNLLGNQFNLDPSNLSTVTSTANTDSIVLGTDSGPKKISYNDLFGNILGALNYRGTWDSGSNTPNLSSYCDSSTKGHYYVVSSPGTTALGGFNSWHNNDWVICDGSNWQKIESTNDVNSVFGRTGTVTSQNGDYRAQQITFTPSAGLSSTNVQAAIEELALSASVDNDSLASLNCSSGQVPKWNSTSWGCSADIDTTSTYTAGTGISINGSNIISASLGTDIISGEIVDGTITTADIATSAITSGLILDGSVTSADIADGTVSFADWASSGCTAGQIPEYSGTAWACHTIPGPSSSKAFSLYDEDDQSVSAAGNSWDLDNPDVTLNDGFTLDIVNDEITITQAGRYEISGSAGQNNSSSENCTLTSTIQVNTGSGYLTRSQTSFLAIEIDTVGSRSGSSASVHTIMDLSVGNKIRFRSSGSQSSSLYNKSITIQKIAE